MGRVETYENDVKKIQKLNLTSDIFISKVLEDPSVLEELLHLITNQKWKIHQMRGQYCIRQLVTHSVVLDVYAEDEDGRIVHLEIQNRDDDCHPKRVRYYRGCIDTTLLDTGVKYEKLPELIQIFVTKNDFTGSGKTIIYNEKTIDDGVTELYFNLSAKDGKSEALEELQEYMLETIPENESKYFPKLVTRVRFLKNETKGVREMCEIFDEERRISREEGRIEGKAEGLQNAVVFLLGKLGNVPQAIRSLIAEQEDEICLQNWIGLAAMVTSVEEFKKLIE